MPLISVKRPEVRLDSFSALEKNDADGIARNTADETSGIFKHAADTAMEVGYINRPFGR